MSPTIERIVATISPVLNPPPSPEDPSEVLGFATCVLDGVEGGTRVDELDKAEEVVTATVENAEDEDTAVAAAT
jgi:hypothetical protein